jgi:hypothetical protein
MSKNSEKQIVTDGASNFFISLNIQKIKTQVITRKPYIMK